jgi:hypothetical protein
LPPQSRLWLPLQGIVVEGEDRATRIGAISSRSDASCYEIVKGSTVVHPHAAAVVEYGAAQCPATAAVVGVGTAAEGAPFAGASPKKPVVRGSTAPSKAAVPAIQERREVSGATTTVETAISTIGHATTTTAAVATLGAIPKAINEEAVGAVAATPTAGARAGWLVAIPSSVPTIPATAKPARAANITAACPARKNSSATAASTAVSAFAAIATRTAASAATALVSVTAISRQSSPSAASGANATTIAANRSIVLESAVFDCERTNIDINRATRA